MASNTIYQITYDRLDAYGLFSEETIKTVALYAEKQAAYKDYQDYFQKIGIPKPKLFIAKNKAGVPVVDIAPRKTEGTIVLHLPMANPLDENQLFHIATVVGTNPTYRVIAFGNPSGKPYKFKEQNLTFWQKFKVAFTKNQRPLVAAEIEYLHTNKILNAHHVGYSYGAHKALIEVYYLNPGDVSSITLLDPVAHARGFKQLIHDFRNTFQPMGDYVNHTRIPSYFQAREAAAKTKHHESALKRPINISIGILLRRLDFVKMLEKDISQHPAISAVVAWGSASELGNDAHMKVSMHRLKYDAKKKVKAMRLKEGRHAFANDIHLQAAIIVESLLQ
ncbi:MAG: hypothetical protein V4611_02815 [Patescibacteria group bacterium]